MSYLEHDNLDDNNDDDDDEARTATWNISLRMHVYVSEQSYGDTPKRMQAHAHILLAVLSPKVVTITLNHS